MYFNINTRSWHSSVDDRGWWFISTAHSLTGTARLGARRCVTYERRASCRPRSARVAGGAGGRGAAGASALTKFHRLVGTRSDPHLFPSFRNTLFFISLTRLHYLPALVHVPRSLMTPNYVVLNSLSALAGLVGRPRGVVAVREGHWSAEWERRRRPWPIYLRGK